MVNYGDGDGDSNDGDGDSDVKTHPPTASLLRLSAPPLALGSCQQGAQQ